MEADASRIGYFYVADNLGVDIEFTGNINDRLSFRFGQVHL